MTSADVTIPADHHQHRLTLAPARELAQACCQPAGAGHSLGRPGDATLQKWILMDALGLLLGPARPGEVVEKEF